MTDSLQISVLSDAELDVVTGGKKKVKVLVIKGDVKQDADVTQTATTDIDIKLIKSDDFTFTLTNTTSNTSTVNQSVG